MTETYTVLIVDDTEEDRYLLKRYLKKTQLSLVILEANSGMAALEILTTPVDELKANHPGICAPVTLFLDINMPVMNGWEFVEELERRRNDIQLKPTIVLMHSTSDADRDKQTASEYDAIATYIVKGESTPENLRDAIVSNR